MAVEDVTILMNTYRECCRHLWNCYLSKTLDIGGALDSFSQIRRLLFESIVTPALDSDTHEPVLRVIPEGRSPILVRRVSGPREAGYWDQERDLMVGEDDIDLQFLDYFDFSQTPLMEFQYLRCKIIRFSANPAYEQREALIEAVRTRIRYVLEDMAT